jgi:cytosine/adenosine deaminase-related metal-dependent hydrolase
MGSFRSEIVIDAKGAPVHPGFIDGHTHVSQHTSRGIDSLLANNPGTQVNFAAWKAELRYDDEFASTTLAGIDLLRHGYTGFIDGGTSLEADAVADAANTVGIRAWIPDAYLWDCSDILEVVPRLMSPGLAQKVPFDLERCLRELGSQLHRNKEKDALVRGYVTLYGLGTASDELQRAAKEIATKEGVVCGQHVGYVIGMTEWEETRLGRPVIVHLTDLGVIDQKSTMVHLNVLRDDEIDPLVNSGAPVVWCPSNYFYFAAREGVRGRMPELHKRGVNIALGVDTPKTCTVGDTGCLALHAAAQCGTVLAGNDIFEMLTINAARAIGAENDLGSLESGKLADIVVRTADAADAQPSLDPVFQMAVLGRSTSVDTVIVNGKIVIEEGRSVKISERDVFQDVQASVDRVMQRLGLSR